MKIITAYSIKKNIDENIEELRKNIGDCKSKFILFFASSNFEPEAVGKKMKDFFPDAEIAGCTTSGEIVSGKVLTDSIVAMAFDSSAVADIKIEVVENIKQNNDENVRKAFASFASYYKIPPQDMDYKKFVGLILIDGLSGAEEKIIDKIGDLTNVIFIGGSAGDDLKFKSTNVFANGKTYSNAAVLILMKPGLKFSFIKTQSFKALSAKLIATKVVEENREVIEFNNKTAKTAYAEALGISTDKAENFFMSNPVGLLIDNEPYVRSPQRFNDGSMVFYCNVLKDMELSLLQSTDIINDTANAIEKKTQEYGKIAGIINFHCILRTLELNNKGIAGKYGKIFSDIPTIGFSTYGEQFLGHINQTSTMLFFY